MNLTLIRANTTANAAFYLYSWDEIAGMGGKNLLFIDTAQYFAATTTAVADISWFIHHVITQVN